MPAGVEAGRAVCVRTPARLHLGIFSLPGAGYGGIGVAVQVPSVELLAIPAGRVVAAGFQSERAAAAAGRFLQHHGIRDGAYLEVRSAIPPHVGLGSGTQLELAVSCALAEMYGLSRSLEDMARVAGRAGRSRIGLEAFRQGGFVVHADLGGPHPETQVMPFPTDWAFVIALPLDGRGLSGAAEEQAFQSLAPMDPETVRTIHACVREQLLPGLVNRDIARFGRALTGIQERVGDYFAGQQGGRYSDPFSPLLADAMLAAGAYGVAQSSWGPALCALVPAGEAARRVRQAAAAALAGRGRADLLIAAPDNEGAVVWGVEPCA